MSPASTPAITGNPHAPANPSTTSETANPVEWTHTPNRVSAGLPLWIRSTPANANGPSTQISASTRVASCVRSLRALGAVDAHDVCRSRDGARRSRSPGEREEHRLERARAQLELADGHPRAPEREHELVQSARLR